MTQQPKAGGQPMRDAPTPSTQPMVDPPGRAVPEPPRPMPAVPQVSPGRGAAGRSDAPAPPQPMRDPPR
jgi:hypothetical protein